MVNHLLARQPVMPPLALRPREAAKVLSVSERTLWGWTKQGLVPHIKLGNVTLFPADELRRWLAERAQAGVTAPQATEGGDHGAR